MNKSIRFDIYYVKNISFLDIKILYKTFILVLFKRKQFRTLENLMNKKTAIIGAGGHGKVVGEIANATINLGTTIKEGVILNTSASIDHDCLIDKFVHISPNCTLSGGVNVEEFTHLGSGTSVHSELILVKMLKLKLVQEYLKIF